MKTYVLFSIKHGSNNSKIICASEDINKIYTSVSEDFLGDECYPEFEIWEDGRLVYEDIGIGALRKIAEIYGNS